MNLKLYLESKLKTSSKYTLSFDDEKFIKNFGLENYIYQKLTSKKFRKYSLDEITANRTKKAINIATDKNEPIKVNYFMGGYKLYSLPSSPYIDFAEFFNISYGSCKATNSRNVLECLLDYEKQIFKTCPYFGR